MRVSDSDPEMLRYLSDRGISPGERLEVLERQPFDGPLLVRFAEREHTIGGRLAHAMRVELDGEDADAEDREVAPSAGAASELTPLDIDREAAALQATPQCGAGDAQGSPR